MAIRALITQYFDALEAANIHVIVKLFAKNGKIHSPLYGMMTAKDFYKKLFEDTTESKLKVQHIFVDEDALKAAAHFQYHWQLINGDTVQFEGVDIFEFDSDKNIDKLTILYDTAPSRKITARLLKE